MKYQHKVTDPGAPVCSDSSVIFDGWYADEECTQAWDFDTAVPGEQLDLYAKWLRVTYVGINPNNGENPNFMEAIVGRTMPFFPEPRNR